MYNKLFSKIVTSSIWLEPTPTRIVWLMFIAVMNEDGFVQFASIANVAHTARIKDDEAAEAIRILEAPDPNSADEDNEGRRIEKVPGGWMVLNSVKYRDLATREMIREQTRIRVARKRAKDKGVTECNAKVTKRNGKLTLSDTDTETKKKEGANGSRPAVDFRSFADVDAWIDHLQHEEAYKSISVREQYSKMLNWCRVNRKQPTQRRFVNWLNRADKPMAPTQKPDYKRNYLPPRREPSEAEVAKAREIARRETESLKKQLQPNST